MVKRYNPYRQLAIQGARYAGRKLLGYAGNQVKRKLSNAFSGQKTKMRRLEMAPLTAEKDVRVSYKKRFMNRRKRRSYVRKLRAYRNMKMKSEPSRIHFLVDAREVVALPNTSRYFGCFMGMCSNNYYDTGLGNIWDQVANAPANNTKLAHAQLRIDHMSLSTVIRNSSEGSIGTLDIDVYKVVCIRDIPAARWPNGQGIESMHALLKSELRQQIGMDIPVSDVGAGIATVQTNAGTSSANQAVYDVLFNNPPFLRYWKILKCWKVQLGKGQTVSFNWRDSKNYLSKRDECYDTQPGALAAKKGLTKGYIFNINGRWFPPDSQFEEVDCTVEHCVRYNYKPVIPVSSDTLVYDGV